MSSYKSRLKAVIVPAFLTMGVCLSLPVSQAAVLYQTGFENPPFVTGGIAGQDGWGVFGPGFPVVENFFSQAGSQAVFLDGGAASQTGPYHADASTGPLIELSADLAIFSSTTQTEWQFAGLGPGLVGFLGGIDIFPDDTIHPISSGYPAIGVFPRAIAFDATAWHHVDLLFNIATQTYNIKLDGVTLATGVPFCGDNNLCLGAPLSTYGNGIFDDFGVPGANDSAYMDNFMAQTVPEPSTTAAIGLGLLVAGSILRRRRSA